MLKPAPLMLDKVQRIIPRLLILTSDQSHALPFADRLSRRGVAVDVAAGPEALAHAMPMTPDAILLVADAVAPHGGAEALRRLRDVSRAPCVLVARPDDGPEERAAALDAGADDVLHGGIPLPEAIARIRAVLRRSQPRAATDGAAGWRLVESGRWLVEPAGGTCRLTGAEYGVLAMLVAADGAPVGRDEICREVFRRPWRPDDRAVDSLVKRLRPKLPAEAISSVRGVGYALTLAMHHMRRTV